MPAVTRGETYETGSRAARHSWTVDPLLALAALGIGIVVGLTGMGGGALMTPVLVLFFGVPPLTAVSSDLVASAVMKPVGSFVHLRHGTVNLRLVAWLAAGSVPSAFAGVLLLRSFGDGEAVQTVVRTALGIALLVTATGLTVRAYLRLVERARARDGRGAPLPAGPPVVLARPLPTFLLGAVGGLVVGLTSVGSGSLIIIGLMVLYPGLKASQLVGTDLVQAVPLVLSAAVGHLIFGDFSLDITGPLLLGSIPGVWIGAQLSARLRGGFVRRALAFILLASGLKTLGIGDTATAAILLVSLLVAPPLWMYIRHRNGFPAFAVVEERARRARRAAAPLDPAEVDRPQPQSSPENLGEQQ